MYTLITLFYLSLIGITGMLLLKRHEARTGKPTIVSRLGRGTDHVFHAAFDGVRKGASYLNRKTMIAFMHWVAYHILVRVRKIYVEMKSQALASPHGKKLIDAVRGKGEVKDHGASFYLRRISSDQASK